MYNFNKKQKIIIGIILAIVATILIIYVYTKDTNQNQNQEELQIQEEAETPEEVEEPKEIVVHIAGAIKTEGVILLQEGARINDAIEKAGGVTEEADMTQVNLATILEDGMKIYIPKKGEDNGNMEEEMTLKEETQETKTTTKININKANQTELEALPGIGTATATKIIDYREENGKFKTIENIKDVSGIGEAKYNSIKDLITV